MDFGNAFDSLKFVELIKMKQSIINIDEMVKNGTILSPLHLFKELNFHRFISDECDIDGKRDRLQFICDILEGSDFCSALNPITSIDLSANNLNDNDLNHIMNAIENNGKCRSYFANIHCINVGFNLFTNTDCIERFLKLLAKFPNLRSLNLEQNGILCSIYNQDTLHSFGLNPSLSITWSTSATSEEDEFAFSFQSEDEDSDTDEEDQGQMDEHHDSHTSYETVTNLCDSDCDESTDDTLYCNDHDIHTLQVAYSVCPMHPSDPNETK
eukprot:255396_1